MSYAHLTQALILLGLSAYLLFGGADFGAGLWHLVVRRRDGQAVIEHAMAPVWEANHVWLIFVMVLSWTAFPPVFASIMSQHWVPLSLAAVGIVVRGSAFVFAKAQPGWRHQKWAFGLSSVLTPYCLGSVAGKPGSGVYAGLLTVGLCAYLAAVYLTWDARRLDRWEVAARFRTYALIAGVAIGVAGLPGALIFGVRSPLIGLSAVAGLISLVLLWRRVYVAVRVTAALAVGTVLWGAADLGHLDLDRFAAPDSVLQVVLLALGVGAVLLVPSLAWLYVLFQRSTQHLERGSST